MLFCAYPTCRSNVYAGAIIVFDNGPEIRYGLCEEHFYEQSNLGELAEILGPDSASHDRYMEFLRELKVGIHHQQETARRLAERTAYLRRTPIPGELYRHLLRQLPDPNRYDGERITLPWVVRMPVVSDWRKTPGRLPDFRTIEFQKRRIDSPNASGRQFYEWQLVDSYRVDENLTWE